MCYVHFMCSHGTLQNSNLTQLTKVYGCNLSHKTCFLLGSSSGHTCQVQKSAPQGARSLVQSMNVFFSLQNCQVGGVSEFIMIDHPKEEDLAKFGYKFGQERKVKKFNESLLIYVGNILEPSVLKYGNLIFKKKSSYFPPCYQDKKFYHIYFFFGDFFFFYTPKKGKKNFLYCKFN